MKRYLSIQFIFLSILIVTIFTTCSNKTKSGSKTKIINSLTLSKYDSITELEYFLGTYEIMAVQHLGKNYKGISNEGKIRITETGMELVTNLDLLTSVKAYHDRTNLIDISRGHFVFKGVNEIEAALLSFDEKNSLVAFAFSLLGKNYTTIFVYIKKD